MTALPNKLGFFAASPESAGAGVVLAPPNKEPGGLEAVFPNKLGAGASVFASALGSSGLAGSASFFPPNEPPEAA